MTFNNDGGLRIDVYLEFGGTSITRANIPNTGGYTFVLTQPERDLLLSKCTTSNSLTVRYVIVTYLNGNPTWWSWTDRTMTVVNANPTFSNFTHKDTNQTTVALTGNDQVLIKNYSTLRVTVPLANRMTPIKGSTAKNYNATIDNRNVSADFSSSADVNMDMTTITLAGTPQLSVRAFDSRNNSTVVNKNVTVHDYNAPVINASVSRLNNFEAQTTLSVNGSYTPLNIGGVDKNTIATNNVQYRYRETGGTWGNWTNLTRTLGNGTFTCTNVVLTLDNNKSYEFEIKAVDNLTTTTISRQVSVGIPAIFLGASKKCIGVNCIPPSNAPDGSIWCNNKQVLDYDVVDTW